MDLSFEYVDTTDKKKDIQGLFVFSLYLPNYVFERNTYAREDVNLSSAENLRKRIGENIYIKGITMYANCISKDNSIFRGWKVLVYTDIPTYTSLRENGFLFGHPAIEFALVRWPYYTPVEGGHINGDIMRVMRFRAFFDFPHIPVFVRDADTIFAAKMREGWVMVEVLDFPEEDLYRWEKNYFLGAQAYPNKWIFGTSLAYYKFWHENKKRGLFAPLGAFAGLQSVMPNVPCFQTEELWNEVVKYILEDSVREEKNGKIKYSNEDARGKVGKDERILLFIFFPKCALENIFFFELDLFHERNFVLRGMRTYDVTYPTAIFKRNSNINIQSLFQKALSQKFLTNLSSNREAITHKQYRNKKARINNIGKKLLSLKNKNFELRDKRYHFDPMILSSHFGSIVTLLYEKLKEFDADTSLEKIYTYYQTIDEEYVKKIRDFVKKMEYSNQYEANLKEQLPEVQKIASMKDAALDEFVKKALSLKSLDEILKLVDYTRKEYVKVLLTGEAPPPPPNPFAGLGLFFPKKGGKTRRKSRKQ